MNVFFIRPWQKQAAFLSVLGPALALATVRGQEVAAGAVAWEPRFAGVDVARLEADQPRRLRGVALRIDLKAEGISFLATPDNGEKPGETDSQLTTGFLAQHKLQAAINAAPFSKVTNDPATPQDVVGLLISEGRTVSAAAGMPALIITKDNKARIASPPVSAADAWNAVGGFSVVLRDGELTHSGDTKLHPRTAAGVSRDGRHLYWLVVDGRQFAHSGGITTPEAGFLLRHLGAWDGINLDGGGTTVMAAARPDGSPEILNRPIHGGIPGLERLSGCHLGLRAKPLQP